MPRGNAFLGLALTGLLSSFAAAQTPSVLVKEQDTIIGLGALSSMTSVGINDSKMWIALIDTDFSDSNTDGCILRNGFVTLREGAALFAPTGASLDDWTSINLTNKGDLAMLLKVKKSDASIVDGAYWNLLPVALKDSVINSPILGPNSTWLKMDVIKMNASNAMLILGEIQNTAIGGATSKEDALIRYQLDNLGNILSTTVLATKGMDVPAMGTTVNTLGSTEHLISLNSQGDFFTVIFGVGVTALMINMDTLVAQEGDPSPIPGVTWKGLSLAKVSINDRRKFVYSGALDGDLNTYLIVRGSLDDPTAQEKFVRAGDILPGFSAQPVANGSAAPIYIANTGDVFWRAEAVGANDDAFMRNLEPVIQLNKTVVDGNLVTRVELQENSFAVSPNGRFLAGRVQLQVVGDAALLVDFGLVLDIPACNPQPGALTLASGVARVGQQMTLAMDKAQIVGARPVLVFSTQQRFSAPGSPCGATTPQGEWSLGSPIATLHLPPWNGTSPSTIPLNIPNALSLVDLKLFAQGYFRDVTHTSGEDIRLTNALRIEIGAP